MAPLYCLKLIQINRYNCCCCERVFIFGEFGEDLINIYKVTSSKAMYEEPQLLAIMSMQQLKLTQMSKPAGQIRSGIRAA